jgi:chromosome segregation ATPase
LAKDPAVDLVQKEARSMFSHRRRYVTHDQFDRLTERVEAMEASQAQNQASIDAETAKVDANQAKLVTVQQEIDALKAQPNAQSLDFSKLDAALASESGQADVDVADAAPSAPPAGP